MPRKYKPVPEYFQRNDPHYNSKVVMRFVNSLMYDGNKATAMKVFYHALDAIKEKITDKDPLDVFLQAIENVKPRVETKSRRVGGATYQVPVQVKPKRQISLAMKWVLGAARSKKGRPIHVRLADEFIAAFRQEGEAIKKRDDTHKMAESNRAFAHLAF
jgi:small subunit ribosomal protein S7